MLQQNVNPPLFKISNATMIIMMIKIIAIAITTRIITMKMNTKNDKNNINHRPRINV